MFAQLLFLASLGKLYASPIDPHRHLSQDTDSFLYTRDPATGICENLRTTYGIVWSCLVTILACVWSAVHPNIPGPFDGRWTIFKRRMTTTFCALIAPELMVMWALRQYFAAKEIVKLYNANIVSQENLARDQSTRQGMVCDWLESVTKALYAWFADLPHETTIRRKPRLVRTFESVRDTKPSRIINRYFENMGWALPSNREPWTMTHAFFVQMGGFMLYEGEKPKEVLEFDHMYYLIGTGHIAAPTVTEAEIKDRSKGNVLSKCVIVLQTAWFVVQCLARLATGLPLSELEVVTLAFAVMNGIVYRVWWDKPQGVDIAIPIHFQFPDLQASGSIQAAAAADAQISMTSGLNSLETESAPTRLTKTCLTITARSAPPWRIFVSTLWNALKLFSTKTFNVMVYHPIVQLGHMSKYFHIPDGAMTAPIFYSYNVDEDSMNNLYVVACIIGTLFGAVHFFAWASDFPSPAERIVWRVSAVITTSGPLFVLLLSVVRVIRPQPNNIFNRFTRPVLTQLAHLPRPVIVLIGWLRDIVRQFLETLLGVLLLAYIPSRIALLTVALRSLRALPQDVFVQIKWTSLIPHF